MDERDRGNGSGDDRPRHTLARVSRGGAAIEKPTTSSPLDKITESSTITELEAKLTAAGCDDLTLAFNPHTIVGAPDHRRDPLGYAVACITAAFQSEIGNALCHRTLQDRARNAVQAFSDLLAPVPVKRLERPALSTWSACTPVSAWYCSSGWRMWVDKFGVATDVPRDLAIQVIAAQRLGSVATNGAWVEVQNREHDLLVDATYEAYGLEAYCAAAALRKQVRR